MDMVASYNLTDDTLDQHVIDEFGDITSDGGYVDGSLYMDYLTGWLKDTEEGQLHVVDGDILREKPWEEMETLQGFLGLEKKVKKSRWGYT